MTVFIDTELGRFSASFSAYGLQALNFPGQTLISSSSASSASEKDLTAWRKMTGSALQAIVTGKTPEKLPPLDISCGTEFQQAVWKALLSIRCGETRTYGELARDLGNPGASRAVGAACGANPIPVIIPCHRVLAANHKIGGFSGGMEWKYRLLAIEGVLLA